MHLRDFARLIAHRLQRLLRGHRRREPQELGVHHSARGVLVIGEQLLDDARVGRIHRRENLGGLLLGQLGEQLSRVVGLHLFDDVGGFRGLDHAQQLALQARLRLFQSIGGELDRQIAEEHRALAAIEVLEDLGEIARVHFRHRAPGQIEPHLRGTGSERLHVLPGNELLLAQVQRVRPHRFEQRVDRGLPAHPAHQSAESNVDVRHAQLAARAQQMEIVDALDLGVVGVDDLPVEHVLRERDLVAEQFQRLERFAVSLEPRLARFARRHVRPLDALDLGAQGGLDPQRRHFRIRGLGSVGEKIHHPAEPYAGNADHRPPEQFGKEDESPLLRRAALHRARVPDPICAGQGEVRCAACRVR